MIPRGSPGDIVTIRTERRFPVIEGMGRRKELTAAEIDKGFHQ
jgi:hypothetical protein